MSYAELLITAAIIGTVIFAAWFTGRTNPVGTGRLARKVAALEMKVQQHSEQLERLTVTTDATKRGVDVLQIEMAEVRSTTGKTWMATDRMQQFFIEDSFERRRQDR